MNSQFHFQIERSKGKPLCFTGECVACHEEGTGEQKMSFSLYKTDRNRWVIRAELPDYEPEDPCCQGPLVAARMLPNLAGFSGFLNDLSPWQVQPHVLDDFLLKVGPEVAFASEDDQHALWILGRHQGWTRTEDYWPPHMTLSAWGGFHPGTLRPTPSPTVQRP